MGYLARLKYRHPIPRVYEGLYRSSNLQTSKRRSYCSSTPTNDQLPESSSATDPSLTAGVHVSAGSGNPNAAVEEPKKFVRTPRDRNHRKPETIEDVICRMMANRAWTTRLQNSIRNLVPQFDSLLVYNVIDTARNTEHALQFFRWVERSGLFKHDRETHMKMIEKLGRSSKLNHARCIILDMPQKGVEFDEDMFVVLIDSYGKSGIVQESVKVFQMMKELGVERSGKSYDALFKVILRRGRYMMAKRYFNKMLEEGITPTRHTYNIMLWGFFLCEKIETANRFYEDMIGRGIVPDVVTYNTMINGFYRTNKIEEAEKYFVEMKGRSIAPTVISYTTMIKVRILNEDGRLYKNFPEVGKELALKMYSNMITLRVMDTLFYEAQRQGRLPFYATTTGEEAINIASAAALTMDDIVFPQYREPGVLLWRGFTLQEFADQCFSNKSDNTKGRQMGVHYGSKELNYVTVAATVGTQIPHAVGAAYSLKMDKKNACSVTFFGDGGTSTGDFHAALNFAAVLEAPVLFICRNNGWAISTPIAEQLRSDGIVAKGQAYGVRSIRVDGNDALALYDAISAARNMAIMEQRPVLIEALTYRVGNHTTSDDSTRYRPVEEIELWRNTRDPVARFRKWIEENDWWNEDNESELRSNARMQVLKAIQAAEKLEKPPLSELFNDVYDVLPMNLVEQEKSLRKDIQKHRGDYPANVPV